VKKGVAPLLATYMGRETNAAENMIKTLTDCQIIEWHKGKLSILESKLETGAAFQEAKGLFNHWSREFTDFLTSLQTPPKRSYAGYFLVGVHEEGEAKLRVRRSQGGRLPLPIQKFVELIPPSAQGRILMRKPCH